MKILHWIDRQLARCESFLLVFFLSALIGLAFLQVILRNFFNTGIVWLDPLLRQSDAGRAIFVSSGVAGFVKPYWGAYAASKAALEMTVRVYAAEVERITAVRANIVDPGVVRTAMRAEAFPGEDPMSLPHPDDITDIFVDLADPACTRTGEVVRAY